MGDYGCRKWLGRWAWRLGCEARVLSGDRSSERGFHWTVAVVVDATLARDQVFIFRGREEYVCLV